MQRVLITGAVLLLCGAIAARSKPDPLVFVFLRVDPAQDMAILRPMIAPDIGVQLDSGDRKLDPGTVLRCEPVGTHSCRNCRGPGRSRQRAPARLRGTQIRREGFGFHAPDKMIQVLRETHETPETVAYRLERAGGINRFGEPNYRAVWGWNRLAWIGGKFEDHDPVTGSLLREVVELRQEPKYPAVNRWHIERWLPPEAYGSPRQWYSQTIERENGISIPALGPYPSRGDYEHCFTLEGPLGEFLQLTPTVAEHIARTIEFSRALPRVKRRAHLYDGARRKEQQYESWAYDVLDDIVPAFHKQPFVTVP